MQRGGDRGCLSRTAVCDPHVCLFCWEQGVALSDVKERLLLPAFVTAAFDVVRSAAEALPGLRGLSRTALQRRLLAMAPQLRFVASCCTHVQRLDGARVGLADDTLQASCCRVYGFLVWLSL